VHRLAVQGRRHRVRAEHGVAVRPAAVPAAPLRPPAGSAAITLGAQCLLMQAVTGFADAGLAVLGLIGAVVVEALLAVLRPAEPPRPEAAVAARIRCRWR
jgi:hypothetical protein